MAESAIHKSVTAENATRHGPSRVRAALDKLYLACGIAAGLSIVGILVLMLAQVIGRELGTQVRGADDVTAWLCAAALFLALPHTFKHGEQVRMALALDKMGPRSRRLAEIFSLVVAALFVGYAVWASTTYVYESWEAKELAQGLVPIPIWIPQLSLIVGLLVFAIALVDELVQVLRGRLPTYRVAEEERLARGDFSDAA